MGQTHHLDLRSDHVVKRYVGFERGEHTRECTLLQTMSGQVRDLVPRPLEAKLDADPPWVRMSRLRGEPLSEALSPMQLDALELALRRMWSMSAGGLPPRRFHPGKARSVIGVRFAGSIRPNGVAGEAYDVCVAHLAQPVEVFGQPVLGHGDANLANYRWDGATVRIVDLEDAGVSDVEYELGFLVEHLSGRGTDWDSFAQRFTPNEARLRSARLTSAAHWLLLLLPGGPAEARNPTGTLDEQGRRILRLSHAVIWTMPGSGNDRATSGRRVRA